MPIFTMGSGPKPEQSKTVTPTAAGFTVTPDAGKVLSSVVVNGDADLVPANIPDGVNLFGVAGAYPVYTAGNNIIAASDANVGQYMPEWTKKKEIRLNKAGTYRISFALSPGQHEAVLGKIYKNGVAYGIQREVPSNNSGGTSTTFTQDLVFAANDLVQLYIRPKAVEYWVYCSSFRVMVAQNFFLPSVIM